MMETGRRRERRWGGNRVSVQTIRNLDYWVPPETSVAYFGALVVAPSKTLVWFEESGHEPFVDERAKFNAAMVEMVRPASGVTQ
jgi:pimeloyl-ACP methyl ester carboxylesterase